MDIMIRHNFFMTTTDSIDWHEGNSGRANETSDLVSPKEEITYPGRIDLLQIRHSKIDSIQEYLLFED